MPSNKIALETAIKKLLGDNAKIDEIIASVVAPNDTIRESGLETRTTETEEVSEPSSLEIQMGQEEYQRMIHDLSLAIVPLVAPIVVDYMEEQNRANDPINPLITRVQLLENQVAQLLTEENATDEIRQDLPRKNNVVNLKFRPTEQNDPSNTVPLSYAERAKRARSQLTSYSNS